MVSLKEGDVVCKVLLVKCVGVTISAYPEIRQGCVAMYYPESNVLVPKGVDPLSRTPSYKRVAVKIVKDESLGPADNSPEKYSYDQSRYAT